MALCEFRILSLEDICTKEGSISIWAVVPHAPKLPGICCRSVPHLRVQGLDSGFSAVRLSNVACITRPVRLYKSTVLQGLRIVQQG